MKVNFAKTLKVRTFKNLLLTILGTMILSLGASIFIIPFDLVVGGVSSIAIILEKLLNHPLFTVETIITILDWSLFFVGLFTLGRDFALKTLVSTLVYPVFISVFTRLVEQDVFGGFFNLKNSPMLIQMIYDGKDAFVVEFSARTGGGVKHILIKKVAGFDVFSAAIDLALGDKPTVKDVKPESKFIVNDFIYCYPGKFDKLAGFKELKEEGTISDYYLFKNVGAEFKTISNSGDRIAGFTIQSDTIEEVRNKHDIAISRMQVLD